MTVGVQLFDFIIYFIINMFFIYICQYKYIMCDCNLFTRLINNYLLNDIQSISSKYV